MEFQDIIYEKHYRPHITKITFNRPESMNAFRGTTWVEFGQALEDSSKDAAVAVIVLCGAGGNFSSGGDVRAKRGTMDYTLPQEEVEAKIFNGIRKAPQPVIAMIDGVSVGSGNWIQALCDLTVASDRARFAQAGPRVGSAARGLPVAYMTWLMGEKRAKEMWMLCHIYSAQQVLEMGLINKVVPVEKLEEETMAWAEELVQKSPTCLRVVKESFTLQTDYILRLPPIEPGFDEFYQTEEGLEGQRAFLEKRKVDFSRFRPNPQ